MHPLPLNSLNGSRKVKDVASLTMSCVNTVLHYANSHNSTHEKYLDIVTFINNETFSYVI